MVKTDSIGKRLVIYSILVIIISLLIHSLGCASANPDWPGVPGASPFIPNTNAAAIINAANEFGKSLPQPAGTIVSAGAGIAGLIAGAIAAFANARKKLNQEKQVSDTLLTAIENTEHPTIKTEVRSLAIDRGTQSLIRRKLKAKGFSK